MDEGGIKSVVLRRSDISGMGLGLGFSIMGGAGYEFPPVIYGIENDSPAARSQLEAGDIILSINEREVVKLSTKEVLKCLRLSGDIVNIKFKRDPHVVSRVRQFLSKPNYHEGNLTTESVSSSPSKQKSKHRQNKNTANNPSPPNHNCSPTHQSNSQQLQSPSKAKKHNSNSSSSPKHLGGGGGDTTHPNHITFSDDLFINQTFANNNPFSNKVSPTGTNPFEPSIGKNGRKSFETFVMTGEAILNCSKTDSEDPYLTDPSKTYSKLTPMPAEVPVFTILDKPSPENSNSLPLPPPPSDLTTLSENPSKSDQLPPPPNPNNNEDFAKLLRNGNSNENGHSSNSSTNGLMGNGVNGDNNNEDTSISSSVMSDSGGEEIGEIQEEIVNGAERRSVDHKRSPKRKHERGERYNEYVLLNGPIPEEDSSERENNSSQSQKLARRGFGEELGHSDETEEGEESVIGGASASGGGGGESGSFGSGGDSDSSDVESMRAAPVVKSVDIPSAVRLSKRLFALDGFKVSDVWRQLSKTNDFSRVVATEYLKFFELNDQQLDVSLRKFLAVCPLRGETTERERVLSYFSTRYIECNPGIYASQDSVHTLTCALMLLNTDLYSGVKNGRKMTCSEFIENLSGLNDGEDFPKDILKELYHSIRSHPLVSPLDPEGDEESNKDMLPSESPESPAMEYKRGYLIRKSTFEPTGKKTPFGKRAWRMYFCRLRELILSLSHDENSKSAFANAHSLKLHHSLAGTAPDYRKRPHVFRLFLADRSEYLFQSSDTREMNSWIDMINWNTARFSAPALDPPCGSSKKFQKPCLPSSITRLSAREQLVSHQSTVDKYQEELNDLILPDGKPTVMAKKMHNKRELRERVTFYQSELCRYRTYVDILERRSEENERGAENEVIELQTLPNPPNLLRGIDEN